MRRVLVTGATGFIGGHLYRKLREQNFAVVVLGRDASVFAEGDPTPIDVDSHSSKDQWTDALSGVDAIVHLAGISHREADEDELVRINERWPLTIYQAACDAEIPRVVFLSSIKVLGDVSVRPFRIDDPYAPGDVYAASKMRAEISLLARSRESSTALGIVRSPLVYGPGVKANFLSLLKLARLHERGLPLPFGCADAPRTMVGVDNLCALVTRLLDDGEGVCHAADARDISVRQLLGMLSDRGESRLLAVPESMMRGALTAVGKRNLYERLFQPLQVDRQETQTSLRWRPPRSVSEQLDETKRWYRQRQ